MYEQIRGLERQQILFLILMILVTVAAIYLVSHCLHGALIGRART